ncbi:MAG: hypothetical protein A3J08_02820, partial [Candidatus Lloydbacteria bacterium RIFCSPLOWO2_02_FULL_51_11]
MREPKVLLVYPANQLMAIETPRPDGSLGPLYLAGALEDAGIEADVLDCSVGREDEDNLRDTFYRSIMQPNGLTRIGMSPQRISEVIEKGKYTIVGINSNFTPQTRMALEVADLAKRVDPNILVIAGGINARNLYQRFLGNGVDIICLTEGESIFVRIVNEWRHELGFENLSGVVYKKDGRYVKKPVGPHDTLDNLDGLPFPRWKLLPFRHYDAIASPHGVTSSAGVRYAPIMTSRGCPFRCAYCHISMEKKDPIGSGNVGALRLKSVDRVMEELRQLQALGVSKLYFEDDSLLAKKSRVKDIFSRVKGMGFKIADVNGVNLVHLQRRGHAGNLEIDVEYLELLREAGFDHIVFPVESGSQRILDKYATAKLNLSTLDVVELVRTASRVGITCPVNMMMGFPDETEEEIVSSIELGKRLVGAGAEYCTFFIPIPFPGSVLFEIALEHGHLDHNFDPDKMNWKNPVMKNTLVSPERILELRDTAWST